MARPVVAVHKFSSCDGCQLAFLDLGEDLLTLDTLVDIRHFLEAGRADPDVEADIAFVEGSVSTAEEAERIRRIRAHSRVLVTIGACATSGGLQALRNLNRRETDWRQAIYARPEVIDSLAEATPIRDHVPVDFELWGCPVSPRQVLAAIRALLFGVPPLAEDDKLCLACKRSGAVCVLVTGQRPCLGPVTRTGCGALCPRFGRDCYGCYGPAENANPDALATRFAGFGLLPRDIARRFLFIHSAVEPWHEAGLRQYPPGLYERS